jgi:hypothetical protein
MQYFAWAAGISNFQLENLIYKVSYDDWQLDGTLSITSGSGVMVLLSDANSAFVYDEFLQKQVLATNGVRKFLEYLLVTF